MVKKRVLVVDDDPNTRAVLADALSVEGYAVSVAPDGLVGLSRMKNDQPDLVLLDLKMPNLDGWAFAFTVRNRPDFAEVPIVLMSAPAQVNDESQGLNVQGRLPKPFALSSMVSEVARLIGPAAA